MKKILLYFTLLVGICATAMADEMRKMGPREELDIISIIVPADPDQMRSLVPYVTAGVDYQTMSVEIEINCPIGEVTITMTDMNGGAVASATADYHTMRYVVLPMPAAGMYKLTITGAEYQGESQLFKIEE